MAADSAHSPLFEEPVRMCEMMREDVLRGTESDESYREVSATVTTTLPRA